MMNEVVKEVSLAEVNEAIELQKALERLEKNRDFKKIVLDGYFKHEPVRLTFLKADPAQQSKVEQEALDHSIRGIGEFLQYLRNIKAASQVAQKTLQEHVAYMEAQAQEELETEGEE